MPQQRDPQLWEVASVIQAPGPLELVTEPWTQRDHVIYLEAISVCNSTTPGGSVEIGLLQGGHHFALGTVVALVAGDWVRVPVRVTILSKYQVYARYPIDAQGNQAGDLCHLHVVGYVLEPYSSP